MGILGVGGGVRFGAIRNSYDDELYRPFDPALRAGNNSWMPKNSFWTSVSLDQRDIFYDPSRGYYLLTRGGFYGILPNEREHYIRVDTKAQYFLTLFNIPVTEKWNFKGVFGLHIGLSSIFKQPGRNPGDLMPPIEDANKLAVDGMFNARGWSDQYRHKGLLLLDSWAEIRIPVVPSLLSWDFFFDMAGVESQQGYYFGTNANGENNFTWDNMRFSFGGGFRFTIPQFPIRISLAKRFYFNDGNFTWVPGVIGRGGSSYGGLDLVISFILSY